MTTRSDSGQNLENQGVSGFCPGLDKTVNTGQNRFCPTPWYGRKFSGETYFCPLSLSDGGSADYIQSSKKSGQNPYTLGFWVLSRIGRLQWR
jgi:hypothetical protein